ncbi:MAG: ROK family protein [Phycisphaerae bacterium]
MPGEFTIGIDLGGTNIKAGVADAAGRLVHRTSIETQADGGFEHVFGRLVRLVDDLIAAADLAKQDIAAIGYGTPGPMSHKEGIVYASPNLPGWKNIPLRARFSESTGLPVTLDNDANVAAYGEFVAGAGTGTRDMVMLTLGTGIGGGIVLNGELQRGAFDNAAEIGHTIVVAEGRPCLCGQRGCLERYASANAVAERFVEALQAGGDSPLKARVEAGDTLTSADIGKAARGGDALAARIWDETCLYLAIACVNIQHVLNPEVVVLGGGLIGAGEQLLAPVREHFQRQAWQIAQDHPRIEFATLGDDAGIIGAAALAQLEYGRR